MAMMKFREPNKVLWRGVRPGHNGTEILKGGVATDEVTVLYTVTAGKTFYLCGFAGDNYGAAFDASGYLDIYDAVPAQRARIMTAGHGASDDKPFSKSYWPPLEIPASWSVRLISTGASTTIRVSIHGWEE